MLCYLCYRDHPCSRGEGLEDGLLLLLWGLRGLWLHRQPQSHHSTQIHAPLQNCTQLVSLNFLLHSYSTCELLPLIMQIYIIDCSFFCCFTLSDQRRYKPWSAVNWPWDTPADRQVPAILFKAVMSFVSTPCRYQLFLFSWMLLLFYTISMNEDEIHSKWRCTLFELNKIQAAFGGQDCFILFCLGHSETHE